MEQVLKQRAVNRQTLEQYVLDEVEEFDLLGPGRSPLYRTKKEFRWYVRDGLHVRSPMRFNGVGVSDEERQEYETRWAARERRRLERRAKKDQEAADEAGVPEEEATQPAPAGATPLPTPRFVSEAYFMDFKFEPGNYYLAGREQLEGRDVLRIEYYPERMFDDDHKDDGERKEGDQEQADRHRRAERKREREMEQQIGRRMNKTALITLWIDPAHHQIVKYTFDNVWLDFLPGAWLVRVDDIRASMTMGQPFPDVWLPRHITIEAGVTLANGSFDATYARAFSDYRQADVKTLLRVPKRPDDDAASPEQERGPWVAPDDSAPRVDDEDGVQPSSHDGAQTQAQATAEIVREIRVHGNAFVLDEEVVRLAGLEPGQTLGPDSLQAIEQRLKDSGRFESVEVRKRYRSLTDTTDVAIVLLVHERPGVRSATGDVNPVSRRWNWLTSRLMFLPILTYADGYGFTYGGRVSTVDLLGLDERLSVPLTWGGTRRAALEFERTFRSGPITRVASSLGISQRENPRFDLADQRVEVRARAERQFGRIVRAGFEAANSRVEFGGADDRFWSMAADAVLDTRADPAFPRNAVLLGAGWTGLNFRGRDARVNRYTADARGYLGVFRQIVLAGRTQYVAADAPLPDYERLLVGGSSTLRGFRAGSFDGDRSLAASAELRAPLTSVLSGARLGVTVFYDTATVWDAGQRLHDARWHQGTGAGLFLIAPLVSINLDVAHGLKDGDTRLHLSAGFVF